MINSISGSSIQDMNSMFSVQQSLTDEQKQTVADILSDYDVENLTDEDKKSIMEAFREEGIRPGKALDSVLEDLGVDSKQLRPRPPAGGPPPPPPAGGKSNSINVDTLQTLQDILDEYNLEDMSEEDTRSLVSELTSAGLLDTGKTIDLSV